MVSLRALLRFSLTLGILVILQSVGFAQDYQITSVNISPSTLKTFSNQQASMTVTIIRPPGTEDNNVSVQASCQTVLCGASFLIPGGADTGTGTFVAGAVAIQETDTVTVTVGGFGGPTTTTAVNLLPNIPTATFASNSINQPGSAGAINVNMSI